MYIPNNFELYELVPRADYERYGKLMWLVFDDRILRAADRIRDEFGPMIINDWYFGGPNQFRGYRPAGCTVGATFSQHRYGRALDLIPRREPAETIRQAILDEPDIVEDGIGSFLVTAMECDISWLHIDCRNHSVLLHGFKLFGA